MTNSGLIFIAVMILLLQEVKLTMPVPRVRVRRVGRDISRVNDLRAACHPRVDLCDECDSGGRPGCERAERHRAIIAHAAAHTCVGTAREIGDLRRQIICHHHGLRRVWPVVGHCDRVGDLIAGAIRAGRCALGDGKIG